MADARLLPLDPTALRTLPEFKKVVEVKAAFPKQAKPTADMRAAQRDFVRSVKEPDVKQPAEKAVNGVKLTAAHVEKLRLIHASDAPTAAIVGQKLNSDELFGILHSSLASLEYAKLQSEFKRRLAETTNKALVEGQWAKVVEAAQAAHSMAGVKNLKEPDLDKMSAELNKNKAGFNAVATIANSGRDSVPAEGTKVLGRFVTVVGVLPDLIATVTALPANACSQPLVQGSFTRHFSHSFSLTVSLTVWCPTWTKPFRTCKKSFTLAGVSFSLDLTVGYKVTCCGATAFGQAAVQACATIIGISVCAKCTATVAGVAGLVKTSSGSSCSYGLGVNASLKCEFAGVTLLSLTAPFGWTITGPCPPAQFPCP